MFTGFKFSLIKTPLITGLRYPIITLNHPRQGVGAAHSEARTRPERHAYKYPMGVGKMTEGRLFHTKHALGFGREPEQGGSEHERVYRKITANAASTVYDGFNPRRSNHGGLLFYEGFTLFPPPVFTGFKFSLIKTPLITGVKIPDHHSEPSPSRGWCGPQRSEDTA